MSTTTTLRTHRLAAGCYATTDGAWRIERTQWGDGWHLFSTPNEAPEEWWNTFATKAEALAVAAANPQPEEQS